MKGARFLAAVLGLAATVIARGQDLPAEEPVDFAGYISGGGTRLFVISEHDTRTRSPWLEMGQSWRGRKLVSFDATTERLTVHTALQETVLSLKKSALVRFQKTLPKLLRGTYTVDGDTVTYSADAQLEFAPGYFLSPANGVMTYLVKQEAITGNFTVATAESKTTYQDGRIYMMHGKFTSAKKPISSLATH